ncbi:MAG: aldehyde ferredoxin oxidoreductase family protein [Candidatus Nezhaarchaeota archaeon]|nr:aldehyde ferredoxin oxidoreductase family protein [Candidatus Nezhaarchaeota archaeon]MCX8141707.1 aldehyde ferredoxin oxidoreductase family protein [Candidatus Nezhaarchaeota archaeon]MDW8049974.1 aldehyde ferredoxin oxidoreductase family protein [Nitrososphaerota archaeon]
MGGWWGRLLKVNLNTAEVNVESLKKEFLRKFLGGACLGAKWLYDHLKPRIDPLSPDNIVILATGPLTGSRVYGTSRASMVSKSPLTMTFFDSECGGLFPTYLKRTGFDAVVIHGSSKRPVFVHIYDDGAEILQAEDLWGLKTSEAIYELRKRYGFNCSAIVVGPAGENLVRMASVMSDNGHAFGRGGLGAIFGSKKLKAIVASGTKIVEEVDSKRLDEILENMKVRITWSPYLNIALRNIGTAALLTIINDWGMLPTMNFSKSYFEDAEKLSGEALSKLVVGRRGCYNCPIVCKRVTRTDEMKGYGPEYGSIVSLGSVIGVNDLNDIVEMNHLCNELGLDTISMGGTLACFLELIDRGKIDANVRWGETDKLKELIIETAYRRGYGNDLAEGSMRMAEKYGMPEASVSVKGLEVPAYDPRGAFGLAISYATSYRGACHLRSWTIAFEVIGVPSLVNRFSSFEKPSLVKYTQDLASVYDCLLMCKHFAIEFDEGSLSSILSTITGIDFSKEELLMVGERLWALARLFNVREGFSAKDDRLPLKLLVPLDKGPVANKVPPINEMIEQYYAVRDWSPDGTPTEELLERLGLGD